MTYKAKATACSDIRTKCSTQNEHHVEFFNVKSGGTKETARLKKINLSQLVTASHSIHSN